VARLRVMTYNILGGRAGTPLAQVVTAVRPDVLLANECPKTPLLWRWRCRRLLRGWRLRYAGGGRPAGSNLLATSAAVDVVRSVAWRTPEPLLQPRRGIVAAQLSVAGRAFGFVGAHLSLQRQWRHRDLDRVIAAAETLTGPVVVAGDFNEGPGGRCWRRLAQAGFRDAAGPDELTFPSLQPDRRIDALLVRGAVTVLEHRVPALEPALLAAASDHLPVTALLEL
jgi:endonuclease/exonuclease/phosphatase family metal-dependent hydrolase